MIVEASLHEIEAARLARIHAGTGERAPVRVLEIKPLVRGDAKEESALPVADYAALVRRALSRGLCAITKENPADLKPAKGKRGRAWTTEQRRALSQIHRNRMVSDETRRRMSIAAKARAALRYGHNTQEAA